jgi:hypothetical protein
MVFGYHPRMRILSVLLVGLVMLGVSGAAQAENPNVTFAGRIIVSDKKFPRSASSPSAYVAQIRKQAKTSFTEDKAAKGTWKVYFAGFLKPKLDDLDYVIKIYDNTGGKKQLLTTFEQYTVDRGEQTIISSLTIEKKQVGVNKDLLMTMEYKNKVLASGSFKILGEGDKFSGKVNFSDDDTKDNE